MSDQSKELQILILEDRAGDAELMMIELRRDGIRFQARRVWTEPDFKTELRNPALDLILADYSLPAYDGLSALSLVAKHRPELPFILVSGSLGEELAIEAVQKGATDYLLKQRLARLGPAVRRALREVAEQKRLRQAEEDLRRSERNYREIFNATHDAIFVHDATTGQILDVNQPMLEMFGYTREQIGQISDELFPSLEPYSGQEALRRIRLAATEGPQVFEWLSRKQNGELFWTEVALRASNIGGEGRVLAVVRDISERKQSQIALLRAKEDWERTFDAVPDLIAIIDADHRVVRANRAMAARLKTTPDQCIGLLCYQAVHGAAAPPASCPHSRLLRDGQEHREEVCEPSLQGDFLVTTSPLLDAQGCLVGSVHVARDITDRKQVEEKLRQSEERFRKLFHEATEGIALADPDTGVMLDCNEAFLRLTEYERDEVIGQPQAMFHPKSPEGGGVSPSFALHRGERQGAILPEMVITKSGAPKNVEIKANVLEIGGRKIIQGFFRDVTAELRYTHERETTLKLLRLLNDHNHTHDLIRNLTGFLQEWTGCEAVGVRLKDGDDFPYFETRGFSAEFVQLENHLCQRDDDGRLVRDGSGYPILDCMCGNVLSGRFDSSKPFFTVKGSFWTNGTTELLMTSSEADRQVRTRNRCNGEGYESVALFALRHGSQTLGLLQINDRARNRFTPDMIVFLEKMADQIAMALAERQTQAALRASEKRFRDVSNAAGECIWEIDTRDCLTYISERVEPMLGFTAVEVLGRSLFDLMGAAERVRAGVVWKELWRNKATLRDFEVELVGQSGRALWASLSAVPILGPAGETLGFRGVLQDITDRKQAEARIRDLNLLLGAIRDINKLIVRERDLARLLPEACASLLRTRGYLLVWIGFLDPLSNQVRPRAVAGPRADYLDHITVSAEDIATGQGPIGTALRTRQAWACQDIATDPRFAPWRALALERGFRAMVSMPMLHGERLFGTINVYADHPDAFDAQEVGLLDELACDLALALQSLEHAQERERAEAHIREQASLLNLAQDGIVVRDLEGRIRFWNKGSERIVGWTAAEVMGQSMDAFLKLEAGLVDSVYQALLAQGEWVGEVKVRAKDGHPVTVLSHCTLMRDAQAQPKSVLVINTDITEKKKLEAQFLRTQRLESVGQLAGGIAHDLNNILAPMLLIVPMVREEATSPDTQELLNSIESSVRRGADMVRQILTFSRGMESAKVPLQSRHLIRECAHMAQETFPKSITLQTRFASDLWLVEADATQMHQVLMNLMVNARDAMPHGGKLVVTAENRVLDETLAVKIPRAKAGAYVLWRISDTGSGIAPDILDRIFDPFFTTKDPGKGTGLGLSTVLEIVRSHDGFIQVRTELGKGTEFEVYVPAAPASIMPAATTDSVLLLGQGELILVVDDEAPLREALRKTLENSGYRALTAGDGVEALALFDQHRSEVRGVLVDLMMPKLDGLSVMRILKKIAPQVPVIACSGIADEDHAADLAELGVREFLEKPFSVSSLLDALNTVLRT